ncbi:putative ydcA [Escherichia coli P0302308.2]|nr:ydcA [Escherichia coli DEC10E]EMV81650.1 putative ydcA [Escherichia coli 2860050]ENC99210.1 putative ydcA [Escherichia coli P0302308.10]END14641.1 putative ydcA [Escherichia coli P0302308.2]END47806.1 putative ydcA [Escherichia coli 2854350]ENE33478.1 putative ydcA [Escherichia coli P0302293.4]
MVHPVPGTVLKIPGTPDQATVIADNQAKMRSLIILDKDIPVLCGNGFSLFAGKGAVRQPLKYSEIFAHSHLSGDAPHWTGRLSQSVVQNGISSENP